MTTLAHEPRTQSQVASACKFWEQSNGCSKLQASKDHSGLKLLITLVCLLTGVEMYGKRGWANSILAQVLSQTESKLPSETQMTAPIMAHITSLLLVSIQWGFYTLILIRRPETRPQRSSFTVHLFSRQSCFLLRPLLVCQQAQCNRWPRVAMRWYLMYKRGMCTETSKPTKMCFPDRIRQRFLTKSPSHWCRMPLRMLM